MPGRLCLCGGYRVATDAVGVSRIFSNDRRDDMSGCPGRIYEWLYRIWGAWAKRALIASSASSGG